MSADDFTVDDLIEKLLTIKGNWPVSATKRGNSLRVDDPDSERFGYVFMGSKATMWLTDRSSENHQKKGENDGSSQ